MADEMVLEAQKWLNLTYKNVDGFGSVPLDGKTGWPTIFGLIRALQHELGITALTDSFGPTTTRLLNANGNINGDTSNKNLVYIVQCALFCKGYSAGQINGNFTLDTRAGVRRLKTAMGFSGGDVGIDEVDPKTMKALLSMDAYTLLPGGSPAVRQVQQWMNATFKRRTDFDVCPCDGYFSRGVQTSLMLGIQYSIGMADGVANGNFGPGTRSGLKIQGTVGVGSIDGGVNFVRLFKAAMIFNGYESGIDFTNPAFTFENSLACKEFQRFALLPQSGSGDYQTWCSLLVSTGDPERPGRAADCMTPLNVDRANALKNAGYETVGRYLTGNAQKRLSSPEIQTIFAAGLTLFPIFQVFGDSPDAFSYHKGAEDAAAANDAAKTFGIPTGTVIYFSVDFDALGEDIDSAIVPHFMGIRDAFGGKGGEYLVGIYGARNTCIKVSDQGLAARSFVSGMSTGFSGNLGFPLPKNWAFDQVQTLTLEPSGPGELEIDKNIKSGRDMGISTVSTSTDPGTPATNETFFAYLDWLQAMADQYIHDNGGPNKASILVAQYLRYPKYDGPDWDTVGGGLTLPFVEYVDSRPNVPNKGSLRDLQTWTDIAVDHLAAAITAQVKHNMDHNIFTVNLADGGGWAGDLMTTLADFAKSGKPDSEAYVYFRNYIGNLDESKSTFSLYDLIADVDAFNMGMKLIETNNDKSLAELFRETYSTSGDWKERYSRFYSKRFGGKMEQLRGAAANVFGAPVDPAYLGFRTIVLGSRGVILGQVSLSVCNEAGYAFADHILDRING